MNGQLNGNTRATTELVFRAHGQPGISAPELAAMQRGYLERLRTIVDRLTMIVDRVNASTGPDASSAMPSSQDRPAALVLEKLDPRLAALTRSTFTNGAVAYSLPTTSGGRSWPSSAAPSTSHSFNTAPIPGQRRLMWWAKTLGGLSPP